MLFVVILIVQFCLNHALSNLMVVQLWTTMNYHWYLKQSLDYTNERRPLTIAWDVLDGAIIYILSGNGSLSKYVFNWVTCRNERTGSDHHCAVIDGSEYRQSVPLPHR